MGSIKSEVSLQKTNKTEQFDEIINCKLVKMVTLILETFETLNKKNHLKDYQPRGAEYFYEDSEQQIKDPAQSRVSTA